MKIMIDPGHFGQRYNKSTANPKYYESAMTWKLAQYLKVALKDEGITAAIQRSNQDLNPDLYTRGYAAKGYDVFLSLHSNACGTESVDYPVVYRGYDKTKADGLALKLTQVIEEVIGTSQKGKTATRKGTNGEYYGVLRGARAAGLTYYFIVEHSFHTNKKATDFLLSDANLKKLAKAEAEAIADYFGIKEPAAKPETPAAKPETPKAEPNTTYSGSSIVDYLKMQKMDPSFDNRQKLAVEYGIKNYKGTATQNTQLLDAMLKYAKPETNKKEEKPHTAQYKGNSVVDFLKSENIDASFSNREKLALKYGIKNYEGTATQNSDLLEAMRGF